MIWWADLIEQAEALAKTDTGKPREISLRRAVSAAYYALFHELNRTVADSFAKWNSPWEVYAPMYRVMDHQGAKRLFERTRRPDSEEHRALGPIIAEIGATFIHLQAERHRADYDPSPYPLGREAVFELIAQAKDGALKLAGLPKNVKRDLAVFIVASKRK